MPRVLLLDALGTLVALQPPAPRLRQELTARFAISVSEQQAAQALAAEIRYYRTQLDLGRDDASLAALRRQCAEVLRSALPPSDELARVGTDELTSALLASLQFTPFDDAAAAIRQARASSWRVVVASNWDVSLHHVLERLGLAQLVDGIVTSAEVGARKPSPAVFERALALVDARPAEALHVGDSIEEDVLGALAAGIDAILLARNGGAEAPPGVRVISSLADLAGIVTLEP